MELMRGRRSESNLYVLQVEGGSLGHIDDGCKSPKKVTFDDGKEIGLEGEIVESSANSHEVSDEFDHLIMHALSCTLESEDESFMGYGHICFGSLDQVMNDDELVCFNDGKARSLGIFEGCSTNRAKRNKSSNGSSQRSSRSVHSG